jgi:hypothetical protein
MFVRILRSRAVIQGIEDAGYRNRDIRLGTADGRQGTDM